MHHVELGAVFIINAITHVFVVRDSTHDKCCALAFLYRLDESKVQGRRPHTSRFVVSFSVNEPD
jgi:hypothetical protein